MTDLRLAVKIQELRQFGVGVRKGIQVGGTEHRSHK